MAASTKTGKVGRPATGETPVVNVRVPAQVIAALDDILLDNAGPNGPRTRSDIVRLLILNALRKSGHIDKKTYRILSTSYGGELRLGPDRKFGPDGDNDALSGDLFGDLP